MSQTECTNVNDMFYATFTELLQNGAHYCPALRLCRFEEFEESWVLSYSFIKEQNLSKY